MGWLPLPPPGVFVAIPACASVRPSGRPAHSVHRSLQQTPSPSVPFSLSLSVLNAPTHNLFSQRERRNVAPTDDRRRALSLLPLVARSLALTRNTKRVRFRLKRGEKEGIVQYGRGLTHSLSVRSSSNTAALRRCSLALFSILTRRLLFFSSVKARTPTGEDASLSPSQDRHPSQSGDKVKSPRGPRPNEGRRRL